jgi:CHRD domain
MNRWVVFALAACAAVTAGCDDNGTTSPSNQPAVFSAILQPSNEVPPITNAESSGNGAAQITLQLTRDGAGAITGATADFYFQMSGFPGNTLVVGAHIHPGVAGVNGPVIVNTGLTATAPFVASNGTGEFRALGIAVDAATAQGIVNNPAAWYFNIHSPLNTGGFARGQLQRIQ